ncbi:hypothetical protein LPJ78_004130 [Coemansia sp. RSA 989]|nr:hypothetical protein BX667DRAFT_518631 [Coemansia mojavensis]KAJ1742170.1 hypothetical protein LPJ68_002154 [Coemansia sp. RSA 1086]KAJ1752536.1 hypothetical protein LPJ79_001169 [Coemansia sp. RSA 1821]KAJ1863302.1 hypothetical protein LPJ78_004130 [Coemansia sp. RSA 989]KAJ1874637.1 hypothetical protein LPJ55_001370 [Coemansia sp. RSA 990]KAJ2631081.1 hypothetical protein H4R22_002217 [Coemansia sp. RSA 1290]KAJ2648662.1 hypothetical protein IWW40_003726 [Coemansia sp. RSA 1250]KAJ26711
MPIDLAADREARRKARYRGKPERARFHRTDSDKHFEIAVPQSEALCDRPSDLVHGMRSISIGDPAASGTCSDGRLQPNTDDIDSGLGIEDCLEDNAYAATPGSPAESAATGARPEPASSPSANGSDEAPKPANIDPDDQPDPSNPDKSQAKSQRRNRRTKQKGTRIRTREGIDITGIEQVIEQVPERMTRSMARKIGVQHPRRHFGEGVSTSQILRPGT